jgi:hypothetical protein
MPLDPVRARRLIGSTIALIALAAAVPAVAEEAAGDCLGFDFDVKKPAVISRIGAAAPRTFFVRSAWENPSCPADTATCRDHAYLVPGDLVLTGKINGGFTCVAFQPLRDKAQIWTKGWIVSTSLAPVAPSAAEQPADWIGTWRHTGGEITIKPAKNGNKNANKNKNGMLAIAGEHTYPAAGSVHTGEFSADAKPAGGVLAFVDGGDKPFDEAGEGECQVRMQRLGTLLVVEDNGACGGAMVTFTGLYQRKR